MKQKRLLLNGKDLNIDADFFKELGAEEYTDAGSFKDYFRKNFKTPEGLFFASWWNNDNLLRICCDDLDFSERDKEEKRLWSLVCRLDGIDFGDTVVKSRIVNIEGERPLLSVSFFTE